MRFAFVVMVEVAMSSDVEADTLEEAIEKAKNETWEEGSFEHCDPSKGRLVDVFVDGAPKEFERAEELWSKGD